MKEYSVEELQKIARHFKKIDIKHVSSYLIDLIHEYNHIYFEKDWSNRDIESPSACIEYVEGGYIYVSLYFTLKVPYISDPCERLRNTISPNRCKKYHFTFDKNNRELLEFFLQPLEKWLKMIIKKQF